MHHLTIYDTVHTPGQAIYGYLKHDAAGNIMTQFAQLQAIHLMLPWT